MEFNLKMQLRMKEICEVFTKDQVLLDTLAIYNMTKSKQSYTMNVSITTYSDLMFYVEYEMVKMWVSFYDTHEVDLLNHGFLQVAEKIKKLGENADSAIYDIDVLKNDCIASYAIMIRKLGGSRDDLRCFIDLIDIVYNRLMVMYH